MGDFASPAAGPNGSICINNSMNPAAGSVVPAGTAGIPKHSTVVERLRQRIEGCRRHHVNCENRYQQAHAEQLEIDRRETVSLYQRSLEQRAKKSAGGSGTSKQPQSKQPDPDSASSAEQRNNTLIAQGVVMSAVWKYFTVNSDKDVAAKCNICQAQVSRGGTEPGRFNTSNLIAHLKKHHKKEHEDFRESSKARQQASGSFSNPRWPKALQDVTNYHGTAKRQWP
ncbi:unnamed protein product [Pleuronectes platessa]|uniref:BED-type domain-containing protein n=1 Tax=Pleuronectes platessa TaxID=8262 RepID=A0A9N7U267_PLEPL|nr:unnamed protein product [Pleuronectes platessa]